eukprot:scaffold736_cov254-Pinguiococcus_pyrenoidosus.AAC.36
MDRTDMKAELDPDRLRELMREGGHGWQGLTYPGDPIAKGPGELPERGDVDSLYPAFDYIYAEFNLEYNDKHAGLYKTHPSSILKSPDRIKLILSILRDQGPGGAKLPIDRLTHEKVIMTHFAIHVTRELRDVRDCIMNLFTMPWEIDHHMIRDYFAEKIALYFVFVSHYTTWLFLAALMGTITWIDVVAEDTYSASLVPFFAIFMALWATFFSEFWKRKEATYAMQWGTHDFESIEQERIEFEGVNVLSPVDREPRKYYPPLKSHLSRAYAYTVISGLITVVIIVVAAIFVLKFFTVENPVYVGGLNIGPFIPTVANAIQIQIMDMIYGAIAVKLTDGENHRTQTQYEDNLICKSFLFQCVNSYAALVYIAFVKDHFGPDSARCLNRDCLAELSTALGTILIVRLLVGNIQEIGVPMLLNWWRARAARKEAAKHGNEQKKKTTADGDASGTVASQFNLQPYDVFEDQFDDYLELIIQYGYATLFVAAFPLAPVMSFVNNWIEIRVDGFKLCYLSRRPEPRAAQDIGTWQMILDVLGTVAVIVNVGIICFTGDFLDGLPGNQSEQLAGRFLIFLAFEHVLLVLKFLLSVFVPDVPEATEIQIERAQFYTEKVILNREDDDDATLANSVKPTVLDMVVYREQEAPDENLA